MGATTKGLTCPNPDCRGVRLTVTHTHQPAPGVRIRYRACSACGTRFKTRETVLHVTCPALLKVKA